MAVVTILGWIMASLPAFAAEKQRITELHWVNVGAGPGLESFSEGLSLSLSFSHVIGAGILSARAVGSLAQFIEDVDPLISGPGSGSNLRAFYDGGILYGLALRERWYSIAVSAGLGVAHLVYERPGGEHAATTLAFPVEAQLFVRPTRGFGIGVYGFGNANNRETVYGLSFAIQFTVGRKRTVD